MNTCEFTTGTEADPNGLPVMVYCDGPATKFYKDRWLCLDHYAQALKSKGGYIYRQGVQPTTVTVTSTPVPKKSKSRFS